MRQVRHTLPPMHLVHSGKKKIVWRCISRLDCSRPGAIPHTCNRCGYSYTDSYTEQLWWDTEEKVAQICAEANAYIASLGLVVDPTAACWVAPEFTHGIGSSEALIRNHIWEFIDWYKENGYTNFYVVYEAHLDGWWIIVKYAI